MGARAGLQRRQIVQPVRLVSVGQLRIQHGAVANEHRLGTRPPILPQQTAEALHVGLDGGLVSGVPGPQPIVDRDVAIGRGVQPQFEFAFVQWGIVGEAKVAPLAVGVFPVHGEGSQVVEEQGQVNVEPYQGLVGDIQPDGTAMRLQGFQGAPETVIVELGRRQSQRLDQHRLRQPVHHPV